MMLILQLVVIGCAAAAAVIAARVFGMADHVPPSPMVQPDPEPGGPHAQSGAGLPPEGGERVSTLTQVRPGGEKELNDECVRRTTRSAPPMEFPLGTR